MADLPTSARKEAASAKPDREISGDGAKGWLRDYYKMKDQRRKHIMDFIEGQWMEAIVRN
jgi:hypothetical protein